jgi:hypothetical protein
MAQIGLAFSYIFAAEPGNGVRGFLLWHLEIAGGRRLHESSLSGADAGFIDYWA